MELLALIVIAYLFGSIPSGLLLTKLAGLGDIRQIGSGNIGATNVLRTGNKWLAFGTLLMDFGKAFAAVYLYQTFAPSYWQAAIPDQTASYDINRAASYALSLIPLPTAVILGHMFPIWLKFRGGKGVACIFGLTYALSWPAGLCISVGWMAFFFATRYSSLGALLGIPAGFIIAIYGFNFSLWLALIVPILLMYIKHYTNITRLLLKEENRFSFSQKERP